jgi:hypothetical protein
MNCKNCNEILENDALFCDNCGAKIVKNRITFKFLMLELFSVLGFNNLFFTTLKKMFLAPNEVLNEYLNGIRKRYVNPFAYLAVGAALSLIIFNFFSKDYLEMQATVNQSQTKEIKELANKDLSKIKNLSTEEFNKLKAKLQFAKKQLRYLDKWAGFILRNFNIITFLFLPFYALLSKLTYTKPHNFGEHIVINSYILGTTMFLTLFSFLLGMLIHPSLLSYSILATLVYYLYSFSKLYKLSFGKSLLKLLRFIGVFILISIVILIIASIIGVIIGKFFPNLINIKP